jgi:hypothetical protein
MYPLIDVSVERGWTQRGERKNERTRERNVREQNKYGERTQQVEKKKKMVSTSPHNKRKRKLEKKVSAHRRRGAFSSSCQTSASSTRSPALAAPTGEKETDMHGREK